MRLAPEMRALLIANESVVSRVQLLDLGMSASAIARMVAAGELCAVVPGVYRPALVDLTPAVRLRAVVLRAGAGVTVTGWWAAWWLGLLVATPRAALGRPIDLLVPPGTHRPLWPDVRAWRRSLDPPDRLMVRRVPVTGRARTVLACAELPDAEDIRDRALQLGTSVASLEHALARLAPGRGTVAARRLVTGARSGGVSPPERELLAKLLKRAGTPERSGNPGRAGATPQPRTRWRAGTRVTIGSITVWLDLAVPELKLAVEVDGWTVHSRSEAFHSDRRRQNLLVGAGWTVLRYTPRQIREHGPTVVAEILTVEAGLSPITRRD